MHSTSDKICGEKIHWIFLDQLDRNTKTNTNARANSKMQITRIQVFHMHSTSDKIRGEKIHWISQFTIVSFLWLVVFALFGHVPPITHSMYCLCIVFAMSLHCLCTVFALSLPCLSIVFAHVRLISSDVIGRIPNH